jgi:hypothetical protein
VTETACGEVKKKKKKTEPTLAQTEWQFCCIKLNQSRRSRKAATSCHRPATNRQPPAAFTLEG